jgi:hypothetical protein
MANYDISVSGFDYDTKRGWMWYEEDDPTPFR